MNSDDHDVNYAVVFRGDIVMGQSVFTVKQRLKRLFKADDTRIDSLFTGKPVTLKKQLSRPAAEKYRTVLQQAGAIVSIEQLSTYAGPQVEPAKAKPIQASQWELAPVGSQLSEGEPSDKTHVLQSIPIKLSLSPQEGNLLKEKELPQTEPVHPRDVHWTLTPYGEALIKAAEIDTPVPIYIDTSNISLAEDEGNLEKQSQKLAAQALVIDTSHLSLVENEMVEKNKE